MIDYNGLTVNEALPSMPVEILGMNSSAYAGAEFLVTESEEEAKKKRQNLEKMTLQKINLLQKTKQHYLRIPKVKMN